MQMLMITFTFSELPVMDIPFNVECDSSPCRVYVMTFNIMCSDFINRQNTLLQAVFRHKKCLTDGLCAN